jgi:tryptophanyl-tRNA synthetase
MSMVTDVQRPRRADPGEPDRCVAYSLNRMYLSAEERAEIEQACRSAQIGCVDCKRKQAEALVSFLAPLREKRSELAAQPGLVDDVLAEGGRKATESAAATMAEVRSAIKM